MGPLSTVTGIMDSRPVAAVWPRIPGYELFEEIGAGGMGAVYLAKRHGRSDVCAVKVLKSEMMASPTIVRRFEKEIEVLMLQRHPGLVQLLDAGRTFDGRLYLSTRFLPGQDLFRVLHRVGPMPAPTWMQVALQLLDALAAAHELEDEHARSWRLIHRDMKPENVMLGYDGRVTILDFGLASIRRDDGRSRLTRVGQIMGTPKYMAPEQILDPEGVSTATDVFAAAVTLVVTAAGRTTGADLPNGDDKLPLGELWARLSAPDWPAISQLAPQIPSELDPVFARALAHDPRDRFVTARPFQLALRAAAPIQAAAIDRVALLTQAHFRDERLETENKLAQHAGPEPLAQQTRPEPTGAGARAPRVRFSDEPGTAVTELQPRSSSPARPDRAAAVRRPARRLGRWAAAVGAAALGAGLALTAVEPRPSSPPWPMDGPRAVPRPDAIPKISAQPREKQPETVREPGGQRPKSPPPDSLNRGEPTSKAPARRRAPSRPPMPRPPRTPARTEALRPAPEAPAVELEAEARTVDRLRPTEREAWRRYEALQADPDLNPATKTVRSLEVLREVAPLDVNDPCGRRALYASTLEDFVRRCRP